MPSKYREVEISSFRKIQIKDSEWDWVIIMIIVSGKLATLQNTWALNQQYSGNILHGSEANYMARSWRATVNISKRDLDITGFASYRDIDRNPKQGFT